MTSPSAERRTNVTTAAFSGFRATTLAAEVSIVSMEAAPPLP
jgi:hypothetical protein